MEDNVLAAAAANGDQDAFATLVERYRSYIYTIAYKIALNEDDALDIVQQVFLRLVEKIGSFRMEGSFQGWVAAITTNEALSLLRKSSRREISTEPEMVARMSEEQQERDGSNGEALKTLEARERRKLVEGAMHTLSPQQRAILTLKLSEDLGPLDISVRLGLPASQVRSQLHRAIERLREMMNHK